MLATRIWGQLGNCFHQRSATTCLQAPSHWVHPLSGRALRKARIKLERVQLEQYTSRMNVTWTQDLTGDMLRLTCHVGVQLLRNPMRMCDNSINIVGYAEACLGWVECMCGPGIDAWEGEWRNQGWMDTVAATAAAAVTLESHFTNSASCARPCPADPKKQIMTHHTDRRVTKSSAMWCGIGEHCGSLMWVGG